MSQEANLNRLSEVVAQGWDEQLASIDGRTASVREDEYMVVRVVDGVPRGLPETVGDELRQIVDTVAALDVGKPSVAVQYSGAKSSTPTEPTYHECDFSLDDLIIGGSAQRLEFEKLVAGAHQRRRTGLSEQSLTLDNLRELVEDAAPHSPHEIDFERATALAVANAPLMEALDDFHDHRTRAVEALADLKHMMNLMGWSSSKAREIVGYEIAKAKGWELQEGDDHAGWLPAEGRRLLALDDARHE